MDKKQIRQQMKTQRANLSQKEVSDNSSAIWNKIEAMPIFKSSTIILLYSSIGNEVSTKEAAKRALESGKKVAYPVTNTITNTMEFHMVNDLSELTPVKAGSFSLLEPKADPQTTIIPNQSTLMIVPGLAYDQALYRTGYGGGYYDQYIAKYPNLATIGVCYDFQVISKIPIKQYDQPVQMLVTNAGDDA